MPRLIVLLLCLSLSLTAAPVLFVGFDIGPRPFDSDGPNALAARSRFASYLRGAETESFWRDVCFDETCAMNFGTFTGQITGLFLRQSNLGSLPLSSEGGWWMSFSIGVSAVGFSLDRLRYQSFPGSPLESTLLRLRIGDQTIVVDPAQYGITQNRTLFTGFIGFIDLDNTYTSVDLLLRDNLLTITGLVTAATPDQIVPEPNSTVGVVFAIAVALWLRRAARFS